MLRHPKDIFQTFTILLLFQLPFLFKYLEIFQRHEVQPSKEENEENKKGGVSLMVGMLSYRRTVVGIEVRKPQCDIFQKKKIQWLWK